MAMIFVCTMSDHVYNLEIGPALREAGYETPTFGRAREAGHATWLLGFQASRIDAVVIDFNGAAGNAIKDWIRLNKTQIPWVDVSGFSIPYKAEAALELLRQAGIQRLLSGSAAA